MPFLFDVSVALFVGVIAEFDPIQPLIAEDKKFGPVFAEERDLEACRRL